MSSVPACVQARHQVANGAVVELAGLGRITEIPARLPAQGIPTIFPHTQDVFGIALRQGRDRRIDVLLAARPRLVRNRLKLLEGCLWSRVCQDRLERVVLADDAHAT